MGEIYTVKLVIIVNLKAPANNMNELSLLLASKELYMALSTYKLKTLQQAAKQTHLNDNKKLHSLVQQYDEIKEEVALQMSLPFSQFQHLQLSFEDDPIGYYLKTVSIIEIVGSKSSGKTALSLRLAANYSQIHPLKPIRIINCSGGITSNRLSILHKRFDYCDIFTVQELSEVIHQSRKSPQKGLIVIDGMTNLLLGNDKQKTGLGDAIQHLRDQGWNVILTNFTQTKLELDNESKQAIMNVMSYFPHVYGGLAECRLLVSSEQIDNRFVVNMIKSLDGRGWKFKTTMSVYGMSNLTVDRH